MYFRQIEDPWLAQYAYLIGCQQTGDAIIIDPERDIDRYIRMATDGDLRITAAAETHIHADFLSGSLELAEELGIRIYLSDEGDEDWKYEWGRKGDHDIQLLKNGDRFSVGQIELEARHTPGHTPEHLSFLVTDRGSGAREPMGLVSGDFVFVGDLGRPDLLESAAGQKRAMEPSARRLYRSVQEFLLLQDYLQVWPAHGAGSACGKNLRAVPDSTVGYERRHNPSIQAVLRGEEAFVKSILAGQPEPPLYFARMKVQNKQGPALLGALPRPSRLSAAEVGALNARDDVAVVDARAERSDFMAGHLAGSIYAPFDTTFPTVVGSYVEEGIPIYLIIEERSLAESVRSLIRIGLDQIPGYATPTTLAAALEKSGAQRIEQIDMARVRELDQPGAYRILDVRGSAEFEAGHLPGAVNIAHTRLLPRAEEMTKDGRWLVYCQSGARAAVACAVLQRLGYRSPTSKVTCRRILRGPIPRVGGAQGCGLPHRRKRAPALCRVQVPRTQNLRPLCGREVRKRDLQDQAGRYLIFGPNRQKYLLETVFQA